MLLNFLNFIPLLGTLPILPGAGDGSRDVCRLVQLFALHERAARLFRRERWLALVAILSKRELK